VTQRGTKEKKGEENREQVIRDQGLGGRKFTTYDWRLRIEEQGKSFTTKGTKV
jgi:hypothetical protein